MRIWALGDIHSNATALRAALQIIDARPADQVVILGDLLTYGPDPHEVLDLVSDRVAQGAQLVLGNHDEMYQELLSASESPHFDRMSDWIKEAADWTASTIEDTAFGALPFVPEWTVGHAVFAHANPWFEHETYSRWGYLNTPSDHERAAEVLRERGLKVGVFGHTHRSRLVELPSGDGLDDGLRRLAVFRPQRDGDVLVVNAGSVGQPRSAPSTSTLVELELTHEGATAWVHPIAYDVAAHLARIEALPLSQAVRGRMSSYF